MPRPYTSTIIIILQHVHKRPNVSNGPVPKSQVLPLCFAIPCSSLPGSQCILVQNPDSPWVMVAPILHGHKCSLPPCLAGDVAGVPGSAGIAVVRPATGCMPVQWRHYGSGLTLPCYIVVSLGITVPRQRCKHNLFCWANLRHQALPLAMASGH